MKNFKTLFNEANMASLIQKYDSNYQRSDDPKVFARGSDIAQNIQQLFGNLSPEERKEVIPAMKAKGINIPKPEKYLKKRSDQYSRLVTDIGVAIRIALPGLASLTSDMSWQELDNDVAYAGDFLTLRFTSLKPNDRKDIENLIKNNTPFKNVKSLIRMFTKIAG